MSDDRRPQAFRLILPILVASMWALVLIRMAVDHDALQWAAIDLATIGVPDPIFGEEVASYVVCKPGRTLDEARVLDHCARRLAPAKLPKTIIFADQVPKNARGKIDRQTMRASWIVSHR